MRIPKKLFIFGQLVEVKRANLKEGVNGYSHANGLIEISKKVEMTSAEQVLLHELVHSVIFRLSLYQTIDPSTEEFLAEGISKAIVENFKLTGRDHTK